MNKELEEIEGLILNLDQRNYDYCLSYEHQENSVTIKRIKNIAARQLKLESEISRYQTITKQLEQHLLNVNNNKNQQLENNNRSIKDTSKIVNTNDIIPSQVHSFNENSPMIINGKKVKKTPRKYIFQLLTAPKKEINSPCLSICHDCVSQAVDVALAINDGQLDQRITCNHHLNANSGIIKDTHINSLKYAINSMADQLQLVTKNVSKVAHETAIEGKLGVQAECDKSTKGVWRDFILNFNRMTQNHLEQVRDISDVSSAIARGDLSKTMTVPARGETLLLKNTFNTMVNHLNLFASEVTRVAHEVGTEGKLGAQAKVAGVNGIWKELTDNVNTMANNLTNQVRDIAHVSKAVARGDLTKKVKVEVEGEMLDLKNTINTMVDQLSIFATEVTRVSLEVGTEGKLGGQAVVKDVGGTWKDLTDNVNMMALKITSQVRDIAAVAKAS
ncbi:hypothetical protein G6F62_011504 [Rhizopus arrhizus]|uniref:HAMP domain-containing protein n=1 Tax=Rhizopus oryzae TaxID=64495 RepID=A0A9P6WZX2_RHIOR|nr:hypothetical protein G6F23_008389 [Rhizopus arrhizus]KAG0756174.1 hypothetical protein G6F24_011333 [Rhizopus arrhizus]KAG0782406.1 hypothetical protein G6F21_011130 [Rhizopus arrhizus]KAG0812600.1 hypothetical protein G6F20_006233 [Rhizopus arrhizus]KAG0848704.1 hypothetical protein G6F17_011418 [Rhizopus arrhizus]